MILKNISIEETDKIISEIKDYLKPNFTIALIGELGTGKTYLTSKTANFIGVNNTICSPTFTILNQYKISNNFFFNHFDVYRIGNIEELEFIGYYDYLENPNYLNVIEWADKIYEQLPKSNLVIITIEYSQSDIKKRNYEIKKIK